MWYEKINWWDWQRDVGYTLVVACTTWIDEFIRKIGFNNSFQQCLSTMWF